MGRYRVLAAVVLAAALAVAAVARLPKRAPEAAAAPAPLPAAALALAVGDAGLVPRSSAVPKGHRVALEIANRTGRPVELRLAGYEDRLAVGTIAAGTTWRGAFVSDLPGDDFAWIVNGEPAGRLAVTGSHLVDGHR
jgi:hypothetical protein